MSNVLPNVSSSELRKFFPTRFLRQIQNKKVSDPSLRVQLDKFCEGILSFYDQFKETELHDALESIDNEYVSLFQTYLSSFAGNMGDSRPDDAGDFSARLSDILVSNSQNGLEWITILDKWLTDGLENEIRANLNRYDVEFDTAISRLSPERITAFFGKVKEWRLYPKYSTYNWIGFAANCTYFMIICRFRTWPEMLPPESSEIVMSANEDVETDSNARVRLALMGDWGSGRYGAPAIARSIENSQITEEFFAMIHLGDIYYSGTENEVIHNFLEVLPEKNYKFRRALNGNHEMYSGGNAYFNIVLNEFDQEASYFSFANNDWIVAGLDTCFDTAHVASHLNANRSLATKLSNEDGGLDNTQLDWLKGLTSNNNKSIVLLTHHNPYSILAGPTNEASPVLMSLGGLFKQWKDEERKVVWYWGHEHACIWYDQDDNYGFWGRCVGHGGFAYKRFPKDFVMSIKPNQGAVGNSNWQRLEKNGIPPADYLVDENDAPMLAGKNYGANGYVTLEFEGDSLLEEVRRPNGDVIYTKKL